MLQELYSYLETDLQMIDGLVDASLRDGTEHLIDVGAYIGKVKGKRLRAILAILCGRVCANPDYIKVAAAIEIMHMATLLHDDVIDSNSLRHARATVKAVWHDKVAVIAGDFLFAQAFKLLLSTQSLKALQEFAAATLAIINGEAQQMLHARSVIEEEYYFQVIRGKTASLFAAAGRIVATIVGSPHVQVMHDFGMVLGTIYQINDDVNDYLANSQAKGIGSDFFEGKVTLPILRLLQNCSDLERQEISSLFTNLDAVRDKVQLDRVIEMLTRYKVHSRIEQEVLTLKSEAMTLLQSFCDKSSSHFVALLKLTEYIASATIISK